LTRKVPGVDQPWFEIDPECTPDQMEFLAWLDMYSVAWRACGITPTDVDTHARQDEGYLMVAIFLGHPVKNENYLVLRADYRPRQVIYGEDNNPLLDGWLSDQGAATVFAGDDASPKRCARAVSDWFATMLCRPVDCLVWHDPGFVHRRWVFADDGRVLDVSDSRNQLREDLGPPDEVIPVRRYVLPPSRSL